MIPDALNIFYDDKLIGTLSLSPADDFELRYAASWLSDADAFALSFSLPLQEEAYAGELARAFCDNLLPEGAATATLRAARHNARKAPHRPASGRGEHLRS